MALVFSADYASKKDGVQIIVDASDPNMAQQWANYATNILVDVPSQVVNVKMLYNPQMKSAYNFVPAIMGMLLMLICAMMTSISIVKEKEKGTMEVLLVSPVRPIVIILAKVVPYLIVAFGILAVILLMSKFVLGIPIQGALMWIILISVIYILLALSLGMLISNVAKTQFVALIMSVMMLLMPIVMLSGMLFPVESMPKVLQWISAVIPTRYYIDAMRKLMIMGVGIGEVMRETLILGAMTVGLIVLSLTKFKNRLE
jgi:ABC-2 type transport system permease protein